MMSPTCVPYVHILVMERFQGDGTFPKPNQLLLKMDQDHYTGLLVQFCG